VVQRPAAVATPPAAPSKPPVRRVAEAGGASMRGGRGSLVWWRCNPSSIRGVGGDGGIAKMWNRREISVRSYEDRSHDLHPHPYAGDDAGGCAQAAAGGWGRLWAALLDAAVFCMLPMCRHSAALLHCMEVRAGGDADGTAAELMPPCFNDAPCPPFTSHSASVKCAAEPRSCGGVAAAWRRCAACVGRAHGPRRALRGHGLRGAGAGGQLLLRGAGLRAAAAALRAREAAPDGGVRGEQARVMS
jgi:hypothetical protein